LTTSLQPVQAFLLLGTGVVAGAVNAVVGGGGLLTFPVLLAMGMPPVTANVTNTVGVLAGSVSSAWIYRPELRTRWYSLRAPMIVIAGSSAIGAILLLTLPASTFTAAVPVLIVIACGLILLQPLIAPTLARAGGSPGRHRGPLLAGMVVAGLYGGYFGVAVGVFLMAVLGLLFSANLQTAGAAKNVLAAATNGVAAGIFLLAGSISWTPAIVLSVGTIAGGRLGVGVGRSLAPAPYRIALVAIGLTAAVRVVMTR
jgi:uncharacterized membrane protein YfcA